MSRAAPTDVTIARLAGRQLGLVTWQQLRSAGISESRLRRRLATGSLVRAARGVYRVAAVPRTWEQRALAACLAAGADAVLCRRSAASVWKLDLRASDVVDVATADRRGRPPASGVVRIHRVRALAPEDTGRVGALPVTTVGRTLVDLASELDAASLHRVSDDALVRGLVTPERLGDVMARLGGRGRPGFGALRRALTAWTDGARPESVAEVALARLLATSNLPAPVRQHRIVDSGGDEMRVDFAWPDRRVALEMDGFRWHAGPRSRDRDSHRTNTLIALGWTVVRVTPGELEGSAPTILEALRRRLTA